LRLSQETAVVPRRTIIAAVAFAVGATVFGARVDAGVTVTATRAAASEVINALDAALLSVMKDAKTLGYRGRYERLGPAVTRAFNLPLMAQVSVGGYWAKFTPAQRAKLVDAFTRLSIANYAARFDGYSGETFRVTGETKSRGDAVIVGTEIVSPADGPVPIRYIMRPAEGGWRIVDVLLKGSISELATKRSEYTSVLARGGFDALLKAIEDKVSSLAAG
jgi:phospholipid transport system substrate-binding protein